MGRPEALAFVCPTKNSVVMGRLEALPFLGRRKNPAIIARPEVLPFFGQTKNPVGMAWPEVLAIFPNNEFSGDGKAKGSAICWWFGCNVKLGKGGE